MLAWVLSIVVGFVVGFIVSTVASALVGPENSTVPAVLLLISIPLSAWAFHKFLKKRAGGAKAKGAASPNGQTAKVSIPGEPNVLVPGVSAQNRKIPSQRPNVTSTVYEMQGVAELLEVYEDKVAITPKGAMGLFTKGLKGTKTIPFFSISAIQFKKSGLTSGYLQFTIPGGNESRGGVFAAASDENTFMFAGQNDLALEIKEYIEGRLQELRKPQVAPSSASMSDELQKLADLRAKGAISEEEFSAAKRRLLG